MSFVKIVASVGGKSKIRISPSSTNNNSSFFPQPLFISAVSGNFISGTVDTLAAEDTVVKVVDWFDQPVQNAVIYWEPLAGVVAAGGEIIGQSFSNLSTITDQYGTSSVRWTFDTQTGAQAGLAYVNPRSFVPLYYYGEAEVTSDMVINSVQNQSTLVNTAVTINPSVQIVDQFFNGIENFPVTFSLMAGGGVLVGSASLSDVNGIATLQSWTLGPTAGTNIVHATSSIPLNGMPVIFLADGVVDNIPTQLVVSGGNNQSSIIAGQSAPVELLVCVQNHLDEPKSGVTVYFESQLGGGVCTPTTQLTNAVGLASCSYQTGPVSGTNTINAYFYSSSGQAVNGLFTIDSTYGPAARLAVLVQPSSNGTSGIVLPGQPVIQIQDVNSNHVQNSTLVVTASILVGDGTISSNNLQTAVAGEATYTTLTIVDADGGSTKLAFSASTLIGVSSSLIDLAAPLPDRLAFAAPIVGSSPTSVLSPFTVYVQDASDVTVPAATNLITLTLSSSIGNENALVGVLSTTAVAGAATFNNVTVNAAGTFRLYAGSTGLTGATSSIFTIATQTNNVPEGATLVGKIDFGASALPASYVSAPQTSYGLVVGKARKDSGASVISDPNIPDGNQYAYRFTFPVGKTTGTGPGGTWYLHEDLPGNTDGNAAHSYDEMYFSTRFRAFGYDIPTNSIPQNSWELVTSIGEFKALGQWGYARNGNSQPNDAILFLRDTNRGNAPWGPGVLTTQFGINIQTQGAVDQSGLPGGAGVNRNFYPNRNGYGANTAIYSCGVNWSELVELYAKMNTIGSDNGIYRIWYGGTLILEYTNCRFRDAANPRGFRARHWNPVLGGGGPGAKTRRDVLDIMFLELWFGGQID